MGRATAVSFLLFLIMVLTLVQRRLVNPEAS
jgi:hypothetical protein